MGHPARYKTKSRFPSGMTTRTAKASTKARLSRSLGCLGFQEFEGFVEGGVGFAGGVVVLIGFLLGG
jgi:hypothetical protein